MARALRQDRRGQMLAEVALLLPILVALALLPHALSEYGLARLKAQEAARCLAWKGTAASRAGVEARRSLDRLPRARVERASVTVGATRAPAGFGAEEPMVGGFVGRARGTSRAEVLLSVGALPWGGSRLGRSAVHVVDLGRGGVTEDWVKGGLGARIPPPVPMGAAR